MARPLCSGAFRGKGRQPPARYYQDIAVERVLDAVAAGRERILLTLATGTGKTFIAFQIAWKLFHARWNLTREPTRRPHPLACVAYSLPTLTREQRAEKAKVAISTHFKSKQQAFLDFVLSH